MPARAIAVNPELGRAHFNLAMGQQSLGHLENAVQSLRRAEAIPRRQS